MTVNVIGIGYIGLPTALILAANGIKVIGSDCNDKYIQKLNRGEGVFEEKDLLELYSAARSNNIIFSTDYYTADIYIIAVPTPYKKLSKKIDVDKLLEAVKGVLAVCDNESIIVIESTVSPGTLDKYIRPIIAESGLSVNLAHAPERILPGNMLYELKHNARIIGVDDINTGEIVKKLYQSFCSADILLTSIKNAEMAKIVENTYRDVNIAFANELTRICQEADINVYEIIELANMHPRVNILQPGPGVGGHCISVDPWFLVGDYPGLANIILTARKINDSMPEYVLERVSKLMKINNINLQEVGIYGLTYKENVDDIRESPTLQMLEKLEKHLLTGIRVYDPYVINEIVYNQKFTLENFLKDLKLVIIMVAHDEIINKVELLNNKIVFDTKNKLFGKNINYL